MQKLKNFHFLTFFFKKNIASIHHEPMLTKIINNKKTKTN